MQHERSHERRERTTRADTSPVFGVTLLAFVTVVLTAVMGAILATGPVEETALYAGSAVTVDFERSDGAVRAMVVSAQGAEHVDVTYAGWGNGVRVRLDGTGSSATLSHDGVAVSGGAIEHVPDDAVAPDGAFVDGPRPGDTVTVRAVGVAGGARRVILVESGDV